MKLQLTSALLLLCCTALLSGCHDKKKNSTVPDQATAPTVTPPQPSQPASGQQPTATGDDQTKPPTTAPKHPKKPAASSKPAPKPTNDSKPATDKDKPVEVATNTPPKIIIQEGGANAAPGTSTQTTPLTEHTEAAHNKASTEQLLNSTEANLASIKRQLSGEEQATVAQIRDFMEQSRQATKGNESVRARNLAMKAHLLSDELVKPR